MAFDWDHVEQIRAEQERARVRYNEDVIPSNETAAKVSGSAGAKITNSPPLDHYEAMIMKMRTQLIDWIVAHGLVDGWILDGVLQPVKNGKIVLTSETIKQITDKFGYFTEELTKEYLDKYLPENHYVSDADYVHTDNNYTTDEKEKLAGIEEGAEVNKIIEILFNGTSVVDGDTRVATITITPEDIKNWYEQNPDVNAFTDADKTKLDGIAEGAEVNKINDVTIDGATVLDPADKTAKITKELVKQSYESNADTNAFTDVEKAKLEGIAEGAEVNDIVDVTLDGESIVKKDKIAKLTAATIKTSYESNANTNAFTDADKELVEKTVPSLSEESHNHEKRLGELEQSQHLQDDKIDALEEVDKATATEIVKLKEADSTLGSEIADAKDSISELGDEVNTVAGRVTTLEKTQTTQDEEITKLKNADTSLDTKFSEAVSALESKDDSQDEEISELKESVKTAGKVKDVQVDGTSVLDESTGVANITGLAKESDIPDTSELVPYSGATKRININSQDFSMSSPDRRQLVTMHAINNKTVSGQLVEGAVLVMQDSANYRYVNVTPSGLSITGTKTVSFTQNGLKNNNSGAAPLKIIGYGDVLDRLKLADPTEDDDAATKKYVDDTAEEMAETIAESIESTVKQLLPASIKTRALTKTGITVGAKTKLTTSVSLALEGNESLLGIIGVTVTGDPAVKLIDFMCSGHEVNVSVYNEASVEVDSITIDVSITYFKGSSSGEK